MADETNNIGKSTLNQSLISELNQKSEKARKVSDSEIDKNEFMTLLVTQLKNQDPLNPMDNQEFASQLAQFSQLEQLTQINKKIGGTDSAAELNSLAAYLGHEVTLTSKEIELSGQEGGIIKFDLEDNVDDLAIDIIDQLGNVRTTLEIGSVAAGKHKVNLTGVDLENGIYNFKIRAKNALGGQIEPEGFVAGIVSGFIPGPDPSLLVGGREVSPADVTEVSIPG